MSSLQTKLECTLCTPLSNYVYWFFSDKCIFEETDRIEIKVYESSGIAALETVASAIKKSQFGYFGPQRSTRTAATSAYFSDKELVLLSPSLSRYFCTKPVCALYL